MKTKLLAATASILLLLTPTAYANVLSNCNELAKALSDYENAMNNSGIAKEKKEQLIRDARKHLIESYRLNYRLLHGIDGFCDEQILRRVNAPDRATPPPQPSSRGLQSPKESISVRMKKEGGVYVVPILINNAITLDFTVDSGAADVTVPFDVFLTLVRTGSIKDSDIIRKETYELADGSKMQSHTFIIRSLKVGDKLVENVRGSVVPTQGSLLLGQSFLERFKSWSIDNASHELFLTRQ